jgi:hypothetical protein
MMSPAQQSAQSDQTDCTRGYVTALVFSPLMQEVQKASSCEPSAEASQALITITIGHLYINDTYLNTLLFRFTPKHNRP